LQPRLGFQKRDAVKPFFCFQPIPIKVCTHPEAGLRQQFVMPRDKLSLAEELGLTALECGAFTALGDKPRSTPRKRGR
jgi:hypothetical protein